MSGQAASSQPGAGPWGCRSRGSELGPEPPALESRGAALLGSSSLNSISRAVSYVTHPLLAAESGLKVLIDTGHWFPSLV